MSSSQMSAILIVTITRLFFVVEIFSQNKVQRNYVYCVDHVISTGHQMTNLALNVCFDFFSRHENQI